MKKRIPHVHLPGKAPKSRTAKTGEHCPLTGWWTATPDGDKRLITEGSVMPTEKETSLTWTLITGESCFRKPNHTHPAIGASIDSY